MISLTICRDLVYAVTSHFYTANLSGSANLILNDHIDLEISTAGIDLSKLYHNGCSSRDLRGVTREIGHNVKFLN